MAAVNRIKIIQHNVLQWRNRKQELYNLYRTLDPDILLLNSHGVKDEENMKIFGYSIHQKNITGANDGAAIAIKEGIRHKVIDGMIDSTVAIEIETARGPIILATMYCPPRRPYLPLQDIQTILNKRIPTYILGDLNARHPTLGTGADDNPVGRALHWLISEGKLSHEGPDFKTHITRRSATTPDILLINQLTTLNMRIEQGPASTSDHLPVILTLSTSPIQIATAPKRNYKAADCR